MRLLRRVGDAYDAGVVGHTGPEGWTCLYNRIELDAGALVPRPIKVGDRVTWGAGRVDSEVIAIRGGEACLVDERWIGSGKPYTGLAAQNFRVIPVSQLEKVS